MKRKFKYLSGGSFRHQKMKRKRRKFRVRRVVPGFTRTGGYFGRYNQRRRPGELKFHDLDTTDAVIATGGSIDVPSINLIAQGTTESERIGRKCTIKKIMWKFQLKIPGTATVTDTSDIGRLIVYLDKQSNGAAAVVLDVLETANYNEFRNLSNTGRFQILMDRKYALSCPAGSGRGSTDTLSYGEHQIHDEWYKDCNIPIEFSATTGAITEIRSNNIGIITISRDGLLNLSGKMRVRFSDV